MRTENLENNPIYESCHCVNKIERVKRACGMEVKTQFNCKVLGCDKKFGRENFGDWWDYPFCEEHQNKEIINCDYCECFMEKDVEIENQICFDCTTDCID